MPVYSRNLLLFCILAGAALLTWVLARNTEQQPTGPPEDAAAADQGYYLQNAVLFGTDDDGIVEYRLYATRVENPSSDDDFSLEGVRVEYSTDSDIRWSLTAANGIMAQDQGRLDLNEVRLASTADTDDTADSVIFETSRLRLDTKLRLASTTAETTVRNGHFEARAVGLQLDLEADTYELSKVTSQRLR
jgi:LPS export ABC transporter protein LptC